MTDEFNGVTEVPVKKNVFSILDGGKSNEELPVVSDGIPQNTYVIIDSEWNEHFASGFLLFTSQHVAVMKDTEQGALPVFLMPLAFVHHVELIEDGDVEFIED